MSKPGDEAEYRARLASEERFEKVRAEQDHDLSLAEEKIIEAAALLGPWAKWEAIGHLARAGQALDRTDPPHR